MIIEKNNEEFWRKRIAEMARLGAAIGDCGKMCNTCAFKLDSDANKEPWNVEGALNMIMADGTFQCHVQAGTSTGTTCAGFLYAKQHLTKTMMEEGNEPDPF